MEHRLDRQQYLNLPAVKRFISWIEGKLDPSGTFNHQYHLVKANKKWNCTCIYEAYEKYWWPYQLDCRLSANKLSGSSFKESFAYQRFLADQFRTAVENSDVSKTVKCAEAMLAWGGVLNNNRDRIYGMGKEAPDYFRQVRKRLNLGTVVLGEHPGILINSGFTKLYFLLTDNFIMYDGRVGAALGLLGRLHAEEYDLAIVPSEIEFSFGMGKTSPNKPELANRRNPSTGKYVLPEFTGKFNRHLNDNIKASWLLKSLADQTQSRFKELPQIPPLNERLTAIQSALFMIGYDVRSENDSNMPQLYFKPPKVADKQVYPLKTVSKGYPFRVDYEPAREMLRFSYPVKKNGNRRAPDYFSLKEIMSVCDYLAIKFAGEPFPLANNVVRLTNFTEKSGLGMAIRSLPGADVLKAQASSYLGPYLAEAGIFKSVMSNQTMWRLIVEVEAVIPMIKEYHRKVIR